MKTAFPKTCVTPNGFRYAVHAPSYTVNNLREFDDIQPLGTFADGTPHLNTKNFPSTEVVVNNADPIFEIPNPFSFRGTTYITKSWAESKVDDPSQIALPKRAPASLCQALTALGHQLNTLTERLDCLAKLPEPVLLALAANSTDPDDLTALAHLSCEMIDDDTQTPIGLRYQKVKGTQQPIINDHALFEIVVNNPALPDAYKELMVLRPGVQGNSEIVGDWRTDETHIFEYLRSNSYIPWGHYAANMANDSIRYRVQELTITDMSGLRHLYYQRTFCRLAELLKISLPENRRMLSDDELEALRVCIRERLSTTTVPPQFDNTLWGWNYGFDCAASKYRLHASHQMIHQQFALVPSTATLSFATPPEAEASWGHYLPYGSGDLVAECMREYENATGNNLFVDYETSIRNNIRMDGREHLPASLIIFEDANVMLFVPKAQTSQWELQLMVLEAGNIIEANQETRLSINKAMLVAVQTLSALGAEMITTIEFSKRIQSPQAQRLLYSFLPKLPFSPGAFSEAQLRWISGHYPEDFARACRMHSKATTHKTTRTTTTQ